LTGHLLTAFVAPRIRPIGAERLPDLQPLWLALHDHHSQVPARLQSLRERVRERSWPRRQAIYAHYLSQPGSFCLLADLDRPVGYAMVWLGNGLCVGAAAEQLAYLVSLSVLEEHRGHGIGRLLLERVEHHARRSGVRQLMLGMRPGNERALRFYRAAGMREVHPGTLAKAIA
jgi:ribosomal protein S18 acetylase RimI-like enzyme